MSDASSIPADVTVVTVRHPVEPLPPPDELTITVGAKEIYDGLLRVESKLDGLPIADHAKRLDDHESRIRSVEHWRYATGGAIGLAATALGWLLQLRGGG